MSTEDTVKQYLHEAASLGLLAAVGEVLSAILRGEPTQAERLAKNAGLAAAAKLAARERIKRTR